MAEYKDLVIKEYSLWRVQINPYQCYLGRCVIALKREGNLDPFLDCTNEEKAELDVIVQELVAVLQNLYQPDMMNYDNLRNVWAHCHWHVIPRYSSERTFGGVVFHDANFGANWSPYDKDFLVSDEMLFEIRDVIKRGLQD